MPVQRSKSDTEARKASASKAPSDVSIVTVVPEATWYDA